MTLFNYTKPCMIVADKGKQIREINEIYKYIINPYICCKYRYHCKNKYIRVRAKPVINSALRITHS